MSNITEAFQMFTLQSLNQNLSPEEKPGNASIIFNYCENNYLYKSRYFAPRAYFEYGKSTAAYTCTIN